MPFSGEALFEHDVSVVLRFDREGNIVSANRKACETYGYTEEEFRKLTICDIDPQYPPGVWAARLSGMSIGEAHRFVRRNRRKDGTEFPARIIDFRIDIGDGTALIGFVRDISDHVKTILDLRRAQFIMDHALEQVILSTRDGAIRYVNDTACRTLGYRREELLRMTLFDINPQLRKAEDLEALRRDAELERGCPHEAIHINKDGCTYPVEMIITRLTFGEEEIFCAFIRDISERKRAEQALRESEHFLRKSQEVAHLGSYKLDLVSGEAASSAELDRILGIGNGYPKSLAGWVDLVAPDQKDWLLSEQERVVNENCARFDHEYRIRRPSDGAERWLHDICEMEFDERGTPVRVMGTMQDITDRKRAEEALRNSEFMLKRSQEVARLGSYEVDLASGTWSRSVEMDDILGIDDGYMKNFAGWMDLITPDTREKVFSDTEEILAEKCSRFAREYRVIRPSDGKERWLRDISEVEFDAHGAPIRLIGTAQDITDLKLAELQREALEGQLHQSRRMETVGRLAGGVAHEFNNMLAVILGYAELLRNRIPKEDPLQKFVAEIEKAGARSRDITMQLLAFSRKQVVSPKVLDLNAQISAMVKTLGGVIGEEVRLGFLPGRDVWNVRIDPTQLDQVLVNLAINARDAMPGGGRLTVETGNAIFGRDRSHDGTSLPPGDYVCLSVSDEGTGMDEETLSPIFEPFFITKGIGKGTGLGLPTVYGIVKQNGGIIKAESRTGIGTTFRVYLPRHMDDSERAERAAESPVAAGDDSAPSILLVEDDEMVRGMVLQLLESLGYKVCCAALPQDAVNLCRKRDFPVDLLITDVVMPGMNGRELWETLKALRPGARVLFMSGHASDEIARRGILDGGAGFINKPFTKSGLAQAVQEAVALRHG